MGLLQPGHTGLEMTSFLGMDAISLLGSLQLGYMWDCGMRLVLVDLRAGDQGLLLTAFVYEIREST